MLRPRSVPLPIVREVQTGHGRVLLAVSAALLGALLGLVAVVYLQVDANKSCLDVRLERGMPICTAPAAAEWALVAGPVTGGAVGAGVALWLLRRRAR